MAPRSPAGAPNPGHASSGPASAELRGNRDRTNGRASLEDVAPPRTQPPNGRRGTPHSRTPRGGAMRRARPGPRRLEALPRTWDCERNGRDRPTPSLPVPLRLVAADDAQNRWRVSLRQPEIGSGTGHRSASPPPPITSLRPDRKSTRLNSSHL